MDLEIRNALEEITKSIEHIKETGLDISLQISDESSDSYRLQEELRVNTRSFYGTYLDLLGFGTTVSIEDNRRIFDTFRQVKELFGSHPFNCVVDGRLASMVQGALEKNSPVPPEFQDDYRYFDFQPWNNPALNYGTIDDIISSGRREAIPLEYR
jgi:hypothetical protein